ncbi:hypothetical protein BASA60_010023 [Batrachochytrium salamandrivorans]|nr:hypothetical protein BASA60_010023 [Batrachochytrium salamandrivorans]
MLLCRTYTRQSIRSTSRASLASITANYIGNTACALHTLLKQRPAICDAGACSNSSMRWNYMCRQLGQPPHSVMVNGIFNASARMSLGTVSSEDRICITLGQAEVDLLGEWASTDVLFSWPCPSELYSTIESLVSAGQVMDACQHTQNWIAARQLYIQSHGAAGTDGKSNATLGHSLPAVYELLISACLNHNNLAGARCILQHLSSTRDHLHPPLSLDHQIRLWYQAHAISLKRISVHDSGVTCMQSLNPLGREDLDNLFDDFCSSLPNKILLDRESSIAQGNSLGQEWVPIFTQLANNALEKKNVDRLERILSILHSLDLAMDLASCSRFVTRLAELGKIEFAKKFIESYVARLQRQDFQDFPGNVLEIITLYNTLLQIYISNGDIEDAIKLFILMGTHNWVNTSTFGILMRSAAHTNAFSRVVDIFMDAQTRGIDLDLPELAIAVHALVKIQRIDEATRILSLMIELYQKRNANVARMSSDGSHKSDSGQRDEGDKDAVRTGYNAIIGGLCRLGIREKAEGILNKMQQNGISSNAYTVLPFLLMYISLGHLEKATSILAVWAKCDPSHHPQAYQDQSREDADCTINTSTNSEPSLSHTEASNTINDVPGDLESKEYTLLLLLRVLYGGYYAIYSPNAIAKRDLYRLGYENRRRQNFRYSGHPRNANQHADPPSTYDHLDLPNPIGSSVGGVPPGYSAQQTTFSASIPLKHSVGKQFVLNVSNSTEIGFAAAASAVVLFHSKRQCDLLSSYAGDVSNSKSVQMSRIAQHYDFHARTSSRDLQSLQSTLDMNATPHCGVSSTVESMGANVSQRPRPYHYQQAEDMFVELQNEGYELLPLVYKSLIHMYQLAGDQEKADAIFAGLFPIHSGDHSAYYSENLGSLRNEDRKKENRGLHAVSGDEFRIRFLR